MAAFDSTTTSELLPVLEDLQITREIQVAPDSGGKPKIVARLNDWQYVERSIHRLIAGWGRHFDDWQDIVTVHRHVWEQAECVRRLRERLVQFPGTTGNLEAPVSARLEKLVNTVLLAPSFQDAVDGIYQILSGALTRSYLFYAQAAHPVHDAPTVATLHELVSIKEQMRLWLRDYRRRHPHVTDATYREAIERELEACEQFSRGLPVEGTPAAPVGVNTDFRLRKHPARPANTERKHDIMPHLKRDFPHDLEARRLFWCYGYMLEMNLAIDQLRWIYDGHFMPWEFLQDISRHLWDESRHGDSGHSRLLDFGITIQEVGFSTYGVQWKEVDPNETTEPLSREELYRKVYSTGMIAETGHFHVKREAYEDFKTGGDLESAEMMLFDIIDETTHVQYAHRWLPVLAEKAGVDNSDYKERAVAEREGIQQAHNDYIRGLQQNPPALEDASFQLYQNLLQRMREKQPLSNAATCPPRSPLPM
jgi:hypothetical protein